MTKPLRLQFADRSAGAVRPEDLGIGVLFWRMRDAVVVGEASSGRIVLWNPAAEDLFGYSAEEAIGLPIEALVPDRLRDQHRRGLADYAATGHGGLIDRGVPVELPARRKTGEEITIELSLTPIAEASVPGSFVAAFIRDATARARVATERAVLLAAAEDYARRLEELAVLKADFTAMVAHELGTPIATIRLLSDLLVADALSDEDRREAAAGIRSEVGLLRTLIADVQAAAAAERADFAVRRVPVPVGRLLDEAATFAKTLPGEHPLTCDPPPPVSVLADRERIGQVLRNLLSNAAKYSADGSPIELRARSEGDRVRFEVADCGRGIAPDDLGRVFAKFGRGRDPEGRRVPGLGLGLYLSRRIVQAHGSELTVASTPGVGSTFGFALEVAR